MPILGYNSRSRQQNWDRGKFHWPDYLSREAMFLVERRISLSWMLHGQTSK